MRAAPALPRQGSDFTTPTPVAELVLGLAEGKTRGRLGPPGKGEGARRVLPC
jgi:hypothetical protein